MADGPYRHYGAGTGQQQQYFYPQQQAHHRHLARNTSPVNGRPTYNETPSPSRSPVSQSQGSANPFSMYNPNQMQNNMLNGAGGGHQRYMQGVGHKYPHQAHQQQQHHHHGQQNHHHHQQNHGVHAGHGAMGHQHTFSGGMNMNSNQPYNHALQNGTLNDDPTEIDENLPEHWQQQLQLLSEVRQGGLSSHRHSRKAGGATLASRVTTQVQAEESQEGEQVERNRAAALPEEPRQDWDGMDMSGQGLRCLSMRLFRDYAFLTKLYIDNNKLVALPFALCSLRHLTHLQASNNQIRELPESIGMLSRLEQLLVFDNQIRNLPSEIGFLFKLEMLGIEGNPLDEDTKEFLIQNGTAALVAHLRDNSEPCEPPRERPLHVLDDSEAAETVSVLNWNILCDKYVSRTHYAYVPAKTLKWEYRRDLIIESIKNTPSDFLCLQELDQENFNEHFRRELAILGFKGLLWPKSRAKTMLDREAKLVDGCAIFYKASKYVLLDKQVIDFANVAINRPDMKGEHDIFNRVMPKDHIAVAAFFENRATGSRLIVGNAHIHWDPKFEDVKIVQVAILMEQLSRFADKWTLREPLTLEEKAIPRHSEPDVEIDSSDPSAPSSEIPTPAPLSASEPAPSKKYTSGTQIPLILAGDFNSLKSSAIYELISRGALPKDIPEFAGRSYGSFTRDGISHPFTLRNAYAGDSTHASNVSSYIPSTISNGSNTSAAPSPNPAAGAEDDYIAITNHTPDFQGCIEYIFHSPQLRRRKVLGNVDFDYIQKVPGFPDWHFPSDHLMLWGEFAVESSKKSGR